MKSYNQFIKEQNENKISIQDIYKALKEIFANDDVFSTDSVYEQGEGGLKMIISITKLYSKDQVIIYTKLLFNVDNQRTYLINNNFKYLFEINCQFSPEETFNDINDFKNKIREIISNNKFGGDLKILSEFIKKPEHTINEWFYKNKIKDISITGFKYEPDMKNVPCKNLDFTFVMTVNDQDEVKLTVKKLGVGKFKLTFNIFDKDSEVEKPNITTLIQTIGETLRDNYEHTT
jgi:hypothetical protein